MLFLWERMYDSRIAKNGLPWIHSIKKKSRPAFRSTYRLFEFDMPLYVFWNAEHNSVGPVSVGRRDP